MSIPADRHPPSHVPELTSGPAVARLWHRSVGAVGAVAFVSLLVQLDVLLGSRGLRPVADLMGAARQQQLGFWDLPTLLWVTSSDTTLHTAACAGALLCALSAAGMWPRVCLPLAGVLYQSFATVGDVFLAFQWDNMLIEVLLLSAFVPSDRSAPGAHLVMRLLLFKLYFESGIAKWQSYLGDWQDGSAMAFYYETAPLPAPLAWYAHQLPEAWHRVESWFALVLELVVPFFIFGPRRARLIALSAFTIFQVINTATANYGFFTYLSLTLHLFLLSDGDLRRTGLLVGHTAAVASPRRVVASLAPRLLAGAWVMTSVLGAVVHFGGDGALSRAAGPLYGELPPLRVANVYHLFGHITRTRIEPEFQTLRGGEWTAHDLHYKPGDVRRSPPLVAPHQPRVDFRLWFYGLGYRRGAPRYVQALLHKLCRDPDAVQPLFATPLPAHVEAVRIQLYDYRFTDSAQRQATGAVWHRTAQSVIGPLPCRPQR